MASQTATTDHHKSPHNNDQTKNPMNTDSLRSTIPTHILSSGPDDPSQYHDVGSESEGFRDSKPDSKYIFNSAKSDSTRRNRPQFHGESQKTRHFTLQTLMQRATANRASHRKPRPSILELHNASVRHSLLPVERKAFQSAKRYLFMAKLRRYNSPNENLPTITASLQTDASPRASAAG